MPDENYIGMDITTTSPQPRDVSTPCDFCADYKDCEAVNLDECPKEAE